LTLNKTPEKRSNIVPNIKNDEESKVKGIEKYRVSLNVVIK
tara:strand:- start:42 stop:164 length:123 start_codon:yes stop_codon:yes gene_type:complete